MKLQYHYITKAHVQYLVDDVGITAAAQILAEEIFHIRAELEKEELRIEKLLNEVRLEKLT